ncbi:hypothetical protein RJ639_002370, partial [Escallonia herrerae]
DFRGSDGMFLIEVDRVLKPGGYFVLTSPTSRQHGSSAGSKKGIMSNQIEELAQKICWSLLAQQEETFIWQKTIDAECYTSSKQGAFPPCKEGLDFQSYHQPLAPCISGIASKRWIPIQNRSSSFSRSSAELEIHGKYSSRVHHEDFSEELEFWKSSLRNYWSLLTPLIFSDHPKRPGDEDPLPPYNMIQNVMEMNAHYGGLNAAFVEARKAVWVMNVVPIGECNTLPLILINVLLYDGLTSGDESYPMPRDKVRMLVTQIRWEARVIDLQNGSDQRLLMCQKPFVRK